MGRKGLAAIFYRLVDSSPADAGPASPPWPWPSCGNNPQTTSFRADEEPCCTTARGAGPAAKLRGAAAGEIYKTVNSVYFDSADDFSLGDVEEDVLDHVDSFSTTTASEEWSEAVIRSLGRTSTDRFFFDPGPASNSILAASTPPPAEAKAEAPDPDDGQVMRQPCTSTSSLAEGSVAVAVDSADPYGDFRASMEEMVAAHGLRDWAALEELLAWYLRINGKHNHPLIVGAFVDLLLGLASSPPSTAATTTSSSSSSCTTTTSTSTTTTSVGGVTAAASITAATVATEQCGARTEASCSSSSSSCAAPDVHDAVEEKASDDHISETGRAAC
ncbi:transcription repressor OFP13-like [Phragmites australis]|uniref:transcription repressor OFP13-like n=1 Tax=Phragmites australis TaxID=29695 RepID=UPI002D770B8C|nr:transcription repressor OFP13-like [Phragmites australis]